MKAVILAGGLGTRLSEETQLKPKPMVEIGGKPILWHIMKIYSSHGIREFVICLGYKGYIIKEFFANYFLHTSNVTIDLEQNRIDVHDKFGDPWKVTLVDTGEQTQTGGRIKRVARFLEGEEAFCLTYGDGVSDVDITRVIAFHRTHGRLATVTAVQAPGRFGVLEIEGEQVSAFREKPQGDGGWINGGFFVLSPPVLHVIDGDHSIWEREPMERLALSGDLQAYRHTGFWQPMDTMRDRMLLESLWMNHRAPWKIWS